MGNRNWERQEEEIKALQNFRFKQKLKLLRAWGKAGNFNKSEGGSFYRVEREVAGGKMLERELT